MNTENAPAATQAAPRRELTVVDTIRRSEDEYKAALPAHITPEKFMRVAVSAINGNPDLLKPTVEKRSLLGAVMKAAQDGLVLDGREAALVMFGNKAQYMPMVAGVLKKMRNSGEISTISTGLVYKKEYELGRFKYIKGDTESLTHDPILFEDKGAQIGVYAVVTLKDGGKIREFMNMDQIAKVRKVSKSGGSPSGPWNTWFEEMCIKSVLKKVAKLCPQSTDIEQVLNDDDDVSTQGPATSAVIDAGPIEGGEVEPPKRRQTRAAAAVKGADQADVAGSASSQADATTSGTIDADFEDVTEDDATTTTAADTAATNAATNTASAPHGEEPPI